MTIVLTTHDMKEAESLCDRVAIIIKGRFVALEKPSTLLKKSAKSNLEEVFLEITGKEWKEIEYES